jgi:hypothetical protein
MTLDWGYLVGTALFLSFLLVLTILQIAAKKFHPWLYWATIVAYRISAIGSDCICRSPPLVLRYSRRRCGADTPGDVTWRDARRFAVSEGRLLNNEISPHPTRL